MFLKLFALFSTLIVSSAYAQIPLGKYQVEKIQCHSGKKLKLGGKFMIYDIFLELGQSRMTMTAIAKSGDWAPFRLNCTQVNQGDYTYTQENKYEGELVNTSVKCNSAAWTAILKRKLFGVEEYGQFTYQLNANKLVIYNPETITKYSCDAPGDYPIYHYKKL